MHCYCKVLPTKLTSISGICGSILNHKIITTFKKQANLLNVQRSATWTHECLDMLKTLKILKDVVLTPVASLVWTLGCIKHFHHLKHFCESDWFISLVYWDFTSFILFEFKVLSVLVLLQFRTSTTLNHCNEREKNELEKAL